ncbi:MLO-like protein 1 isoform X1 [Prosopis cineraria]|uniref:MLO-like protein 1 isoform X1 n=1 Tax=Prosopis cineraria TaxID=364024 RepID=UPI00241058A6|nr:MLO-like protein 1 isoform X1 [Prosopis cineraria]
MPLTRFRVNFPIFIEAYRTNTAIHLFIFTPVIDRNRAKVWDCGWLNVRQAGLREIEIMEVMSREAKREKVRLVLPPKLGPVEPRVYKTVSLKELMLLGFISLLLTVTQNGITEIRVPAGLTRHMLPCNPDRGEGEESITSTSHFQSFFSFPGISGTARRLLAGASSSRSYCVRKNKVPLLSVEAIHHLRIFIFVLALVHVTYCVLTVFFGGLKIRQWKHWEDSIAKDNYETQKDHSCSPA